MSTYEDKAIAQAAQTTANAACPKTLDVVTSGVPDMAYPNARQLVAGSGVSISTATPGQISISATGGTQWNLYGLYSALPAAGTAGRIYTCTDAPSYIDTGSEWLLIPPGTTIGIKKAGVATDFTWLNQGTATATNLTGGMVEIDAPASGAGEFHRVLYKPLTSVAGAYRIRVAYRPSFVDSGGFPSSGIMLLTSTGGGNYNWVTGHITQNGSSLLGYGSHYGTWNGANMAYGSFYANNLVVVGTNTYTFWQYWRGSDVRWIEWYCDGVTRYYSVSDDGFTWRRTASQGATDNLGGVPTLFGIYVNPQNIASRGVFFGIYTATS